jgi:hypothetical protein
MEVSRTFREEHDEYGVDAGGDDLNIERKTPGPVVVILGSGHHHARGGHLANVVAAEAS